MQPSRTLQRNRRTSRGPLGKANKQDKGQALIEVALVFPIFLLLLLVAIEFGRAAYVSIEVSNAALAGVQYGAQTPQTAGDIAGIQTAASNDAPDITLGTTSVSQACICSNGGASTCLSTDCPGSNIETILTVQTQATFNPGFNVPGLPALFTLHGEAVQKVLQ